MIYQTVAEESNFTSPGS